jgi:hypothetical protein
MFVPIRWDQATRLIAWQSRSRLPGMNMRTVTRDQMALVSDAVPLPDVTMRQDSRWSTLPVGLTRDPAITALTMTEPRRHRADIHLSSRCRMELG